jgi:hypothetical protein
MVREVGSVTVLLLLARSSVSGSRTEFNGRTHRPGAPAAEVVPLLLAMEPYFSGGVYVNYIQADLPDWQHAYYGDNYERLRAVKVEYDKNDLFRFPQDLLQ